jgi:hypothetical protein
MVLANVTGAGQITAGVETFEGLREGDLVRITQGGLTQQVAVDEVSADGSQVRFTSLLRNDFTLGTSGTVKVDRKLDANLQMNEGDRLVLVTPGGTIQPGSFEIDTIADDGYRLVFTSESTRLLTGIQQDSFDRLYSLQLDPSQPVLVKNGDLVRFEFDGQPAIYTYTGLTNQLIDLSSLTSFDLLLNPTLWQRTAVADYPENTGSLVSTATGPGDFLAGRDFTLFAGGGTDSFITDGSVDAGRNLTIQMGAGEDMVDIRGSVPISDDPPRNIP